MINKAKEKRSKKFQEFASQNLSDIGGLLQKFSPDSNLHPQVIDFLNSAVQGKECQLTIPANFDVGVLSLLLNNMSFWLGNTQQSLKNQEFIKKELDIQKTND